jgi:4a-hydroxytetrahydrobiopterin dehydratase
MTNLAEKTCTPCRGGVPPLTAQQAEELRGQSPEWALVNDAHRIERNFRFRNFREALAFVQKVGEIAESEGHHPDVNFGRGYATVSLRTKKIKGLHENDYVLVRCVDDPTDDRRLHVDRHPGLASRRAVARRTRLLAFFWASGAAQNWVYSRFRRCVDHSTGGLAANDRALLILSANLISFAAWLLWLAVAIWAALRSCHGSDLSSVTSRTIQAT